MAFENCHEAATVRALLYDCRIDPTIRDLQLTSWNVHGDSVRALLSDSRTLVNASDNNVMTGLCLALAENHIHIACLLVGQPVDVTLGALGAAIYHVKSWEALKLITATYLDTSSTKNATTNSSSLPSSAAGCTARRSHQ